MTVRLADDGTILLEGRCPIEDAESLLQLLLRTPGGCVDLRSCNHAHTAVIQVLIAAKPKIRTPSPAPFLRFWVEPALLVTEV
jgi:hypothetical protein